MSNVTGRDHAVAPGVTPAKAIRWCAVIFNPTAGRSGRARLRRALRHLSARGVASTVISTTGPGHATEVARTVVASGVDAVVVAGGDGTVSEVVNGMADTGVPLGLLPLGSANVLARDIGLDRDPCRTADCIADGLTRRIYLGYCNGRHFVMMASAGFDAHVVANVDVRMKRVLGRAAYIYSALRLLPHFRKRVYRLRVDGASLEAASVIVAKGQHYAGPFVVAEQARLDAAELHVCLFARGGRANLVRYAAAMTFNRLSSLADFGVVTANEVCIDGPEGEPVQTDGDATARLPARIRLAGSLEILMPSVAARSAAQATR